jgi:outer membrane protein insertion porin family
LCDEIGGRLTSLIGFSTLYDDTDGIRPTRGQRLTWSEDFAGLGGDVKYIRSRADATKFKSFGGGWIFSIHGEGGYVAPLQKSSGPGIDPIRLNDRFFDIGIRGFDLRGIGPRIQRVPYDSTGALTTGKAKVTDALGGRAYYLARAELQLPVSSAIKNLGLRPSIYADAGSLWSLTTPTLTDVVAACSPKVGETGLTGFTSPSPTCNIDYAGNAHDPAKFNATPGFKELFLGNSSKPRVSVGIGVNWVSPFGPLRIDIAKALLKQKGDNAKLFTFNVGTQF